MLSCLPTDLLGFVQLAWMHAIWWSLSDASGLYADNSSAMKCLKECLDTSWRFWMRSLSVWRGCSCVECVDNNVCKMYAGWTLFRMIVFDTLYNKFFVLFLYASKILSLSIKYEVFFLLYELCWLYIVSIVILHGGKCQWRWWASWLFWAFSSSKHFIKHLDIVAIEEGGGG